MGKQKIDSSKVMPLSSIYSATALTAQDAHRVPNTVLESSRFQPGIPLQSEHHQPGGRLQHSGVQNVGKLQQPKALSTYMDEFKNGFPTSGLSSLSFEWWGNGSPEESPASKETKQEPLDTATTDPCALLCSSRKRAAEEGRAMLSSKATGRPQACRVNKRQRAVLMQVFGSALPEQWRDDARS